jgi:hypothetical protein
VAGPTDWRTAPRLSATAAEVEACLATGYPAVCSIPAVCKVFDAPDCQPAFTTGP